MSEAAHEEDEEEAEAEVIEVAAEEEQQEEDKGSAIPPTPLEESIGSRSMDTPAFLSRL